MLVDLIMLAAVLKVGLALLFPALDETGSSLIANKKMTVRAHRAAR
jgi:hypothetical protein